MTSASITLARPRCLSGDKRGDTSETIVWLILLAILAMVLFVILLKHNFFTGGP